MVEPDLPRVRDYGDQGGVRDSAAAVVGAGHRIGNHEKREQQQRAAFELMRPHGPSLTEVLEAHRERAKIEREERPADIAAARAIRDEHAEHHDPSRDGNVLAPLARRHPRAGKKDDREDEAEGRGIEQMLASKSEK